MEAVTILGCRRIVCRKLLFMPQIVPRIKRTFTFHVLSLMLIFVIFEMKAPESPGERRKLLDDSVEGAGTDAAQFKIAQVSQSCPLVWQIILNCQQCFFYNLYPTYCLWTTFVRVCVCVCVWRCCNQYLIIEDAPFCLHLPLCTSLPPSLPSLRGFTAHEKSVRNGLSCLFQIQKASKFDYSCRSREMASFSLILMDSTHKSSTRKYTHSLQHS